VTVVPFPAPPVGPAPAIAEGETVAAAVYRYLDSIQVRTTRDSYAETLSRLTALAGGRPAAVLMPEDYAAVMGRWNGAAAATWNRHLSALMSFTAWAGRQEILTANPGRRLERRKPARRGDRSIPRARLDKLLTDDQHGLRERVLWRMLYETATRAGELLSLNIEDLDLEFRRGRVTSKGGAIEYVHWATGTARLLPRLLRGRTSGPVFLAGRRAPVSGSRAPAEADICPETGRGRLSYPRAEYLFKQATAAHDPHEKGWTLHQLRHSALQHLAAGGRTAPELQAKSRHMHLGSLGRYVQLGEQTSAQVTAGADPAARRRTR
jgi:integrase